MDIFRESLLSLSHHLIERRLWREESMEKTRKGIDKKRYIIFFLRLFSSMSLKSHTYYKLIFVLVFFHALCPALPHTLLYAQPIQSIICFQIPRKSPLSTSNHQHVFKVFMNFLFLRIPKYLRTEPLALTNDLLMQISPPPSDLCDN